jgi:hypothetical protein
MKKIILGLLFLSSISFGREVNFSWKPIDEGASYEIQVDTKEDFPAPTVTQIIQGTEYKADLFPGKYFYRVRVNDGKNTPGKWTETTPVSVHGGFPDPMQPADKLVLKYFEIRPSVNLSWSQVDKAVQYKLTVKNMDSKDSTVKEPVLKDTTVKEAIDKDPAVKEPSAENMVDTNVTETTYKVTDVSEGTYQWQVASVLEGDNTSPYFPARTFQIIRIPLVIPVLKNPIKKVVLGLKDNPIVFDWKQDPNTHFTDITIQSVDDPTIVEKIPNVKGSTFKKDFAKMGKYKWFVTTKEGPDTAGVSSEPAEFTLFNDPIHGGNYEVEISGSYANDLYATTSTLQTNGGQSISQTSQTTASIYGFSAGYYLTRGLGLFIAERGGSLLFENFNGYQREQDAQIRLRMGGNGFSQEFWLGYRQMDFLEVENTPTKQNINFTTTGPLLGTRLTADVNPRLKILFTAYYYMPLVMQGDNGTVMADIPGGSLGVKWNVADHLWFGYRIGLERVNGNYIAPNQAPGVNSSWTLWRTEPFWFSMSYEN